MRKLLFIGLVSAALAAPIYADGQEGSGPGNSGHSDDYHAAPEINAASATSAFVLLGGSMLVITGRRRKQTANQ